jgi:hypothetical protein
MSFAICDVCQHPYVVGSDPATPHRCLHCDVPLRSVPRAEFFDHLERIREAPPHQQPNDNEPAREVINEPDPSRPPSPLLKLPTP